METERPLTPHLRLPRIHPLAWFALGLLLFVPGLGAYHLFDWDEINFAESAREMLLSGDYTRVQIGFRPFWEKPPLFIWLQTLSMALFGVNEMAARLPNALCGATTLAVLAHFGARIHKNSMAALWPLMYLGSFLPFLYFKSGIIDPVFNLFIFLGVWQLWAACTPGQSRPLRAVLCSGLCIGLAVLTKGPVGLLLPLLALGAMWGLQRFRRVLALGHLAAWLATVALVSFAWFGPETVRNGPWFILTFIQYQIRLFTTPDAGHGQPFFYHPLVLLLGCFPASVWALGRLNMLRSEAADVLPAASFQRWMQVLFWVTLILFSISKTKIVHYSSLCYFPITYLAARHLEALLSAQARPKGWQLGLFLGIGTVLALAFLGLPLIGMNTASIIPLIKDKFAVANLQANVQWSYIDLVLPFTFLCAVVFAFVLYRRGQAGQATPAMAVAVAVFLFFAGLTIVPRIEAYSQGAAIAFAQQVATRTSPQGIVRPLGYKSYANLFYGNYPPTTDTLFGRTDAVNDERLLHQAQPVPVYFITKINMAPRYDTLPGLEKIGEKNGFVFYRKR